MTATKGKKIIIKKKGGGLEYCGVKAKNSLVAKAVNCSKRTCFYPTGNIPLEFKRSVSGPNVYGRSRMPLLAL